MRIRLSALFFCLFLFSFGAVAWLAHQEMTADSYDRDIVTGQNHLSVVAVGLQASIQNLRTDLINGGSQFLFSARVRISGNNINFDQVKFLENSAVQKWASPYTLLAFQNYKINKLPADSIGVYSIIDPQRKAYVLYVDRYSQDEARVGILGTEFFLSSLKLATDFKPIIFNSEYQAISHWDAAYNGALLKGDANVENINQANDVSNFFNTEAGLVFFEKISPGNLTVLLRKEKTPISSLPMQIFFVGCGLAILALGISWSAFKPQEALPNLPNVAPVANEVSPYLANEKAKSLTKEFAETIWPYMNSVLTFARAAEVQAHSEGIRYNIRQIENQARQAKEILSTMRGQLHEHTHAEKMKVHHLLEETLKPIRSRMTAENIQVTVTAPSDLEMTGSEELYTKALRLVVENALDSMKNCMLKSLKVTAEEHGEYIRVVVEDSGQGMSKEQVMKSIEPFYSTKADAHGLGLPTALSILQSSGGKLEIDSLPLKGTKVIFSFQKNFEPKALIQAVTEKSKVDISAEAEESDRQDTLKMSEEPVEKPNPLIVDDSAEKIIDEMDTEIGISPFATAPSTPRHFAENNTQNNVQSALDTSSLDNDETIARSPYQQQPQSQPKPSSVEPTSFRLDLPHFKPPKKKMEMDELTVTIRKPQKKSSSHTDVEDEL